MGLTLGRSGGIAQSLKKRTVGNINIGHVYDGPNHIWPTSTINFSDFTSVQLRYLWGINDGRDLDTKSYYVNSPISDLNYYPVGWSWNNNKIPYLYWGGDNVESGAECVMFNIESMIELQDKMPDIMTMNICANWFGSKYSGNVTIECTAYKGGVIVKAWQLNNAENDQNDRGIYLYPLADGSIKMPDNEGGYKDCWFGEVVIRNNKVGSANPTYFRINPVNDTVFELPNIKIKRLGGGFIHEGGYCWYENRPNNKYKVWNNQTNIDGTIMQFSPPTVELITEDNEYTYTYGTAMLNTDNTLYNINYNNQNNFGFGFVAGNSEFRGQQTIRCNVQTQGGKANDGKTSVGEIKYTKLNKIGELTVYNPIDN